MLLNQTTTPLAIYLFQKSLRDKTLERELEIAVNDINR